MHYFRDESISHFRDKDVPLFVVGLLEGATKNTHGHAKCKISILPKGAEKASAEGNCCNQNQSVIGYAPKAFVEKRLFN